MASDQGGQGHEGSAERVTPAVEQGDPATHSEVSTPQDAISEKVLVDRIRRSDRWMIFLTAAIAFSGVVSAIIFWRQLDAMRGQLDIMSADQRPWISVEQLSISSPLSYDAAGWQFGNRWHITLTYKLKNFGKTPATHVIFWAHMAPIGLRYQDSDGAIRGTFVGDELNAACAWPERSTEMGVDTGRLMFPGEEWPPKTFEVSGNEKAFAAAKAANSQYAGDFLIPICVAYRSAFGNVRGLVGVLTGVPQDESKKAILGVDKYRTAEGYRLGKRSRLPIDLGGETIIEPDLVLGEPGFQASDIK